MTEPKASYASCPNCGNDMGKTYDEDEKYLPACPICGTQTKFSQNKKHEEIKRMAEKITIQSLICTNSKKGKYRCCSASEAWRTAEEFYDYAKEKENSSTPKPHPNDLIGSKVRNLMRIAKTCKTVEDTIHFMYNDYKIIVEKQEGK